MSKNIIIAIAAVLLLGAVVVVLAMLPAKPRQQPSPSLLPSLTPTLTPLLTPTPTQSGPTPTISSKTRIKIFLVAIDDNGKSGKKIGCGDSVVPVIREIARTQTPLKDSLRELLSLKDQYFGKSGLYNALYQSNLQVVNAIIINNTVRITLSGNLQLGGVCDAPRIENQLKETALQFASVKNVTILLNGKPIEEALSSK